MTIHTLMAVRWNDADGGYDPVNHWSRTDQYTTQESFRFAWMHKNPGNDIHVARVETTLVDGIPHHKINSLARIECFNPSVWEKLTDIARVWLSVDTTRMTLEDSTCRKLYNGPKHPYRL